MKAQKILALIPARSGSKGVPNKNILNLGGHPLLAWSIQAAIKTPEITDVVVSTDSEEYKNIAEKYGAMVPFLRPSSFSQDASGDIDFVRHALNYFDVAKSEIDLIVHLRPTTPLRDPQIVSEAIQEFILDNGTNTALRSVHKTSESVYKAFELSEHKTLVTIFEKNSNIEKANQPRQDYPSTYIANGFVDIIRPNLVRQSGLIHGNNVRAFETEVALELDCQEDIDLIKFKLNSDCQFKNRLWS